MSYFVDCKNVATFLSHKILFLPQGPEYLAHNLCGIKKQRRQLLLYYEKQIQ